MIKIKILKLRGFIGLILTASGLLQLHNYREGDCVVPPRGPELCGYDAWGYALGYLICMIVGIVMLVLSIRVSTMNKYKDEKKIPGPDLDI